LFCLCFIVLQACSTRPLTPVSDLSGLASGNKSYRVESGDTLFSIAWRFDLDYKKLAKANGIASPYTIYRGQTLQLKEQALSAKSARKSTVSQNSSPPVTKRVNSASKTTTQVVSKKQALVIKADPSDSGWLWPVVGKVIANFSERAPTNKGLDISAVAGSPIISSRSGKVVYAGSRLKGYGNLLIVKHSEDYLSAYAHNKVLLVKEGDWVKQGQKIAELGSTGAREAKLHFEIRKQGKPVDPLKYLMKR
jgi:lipoprotein NlpD